MVYSQDAETPRAEIILPLPGQVLHSKGLVKKEDLKFARRPRGRDGVEVVARAREEAPGEVGEVRDYLLVELWREVK